MKVPQEYLDKLNASNGFTPEGNPVNTQRVEGHTPGKWHVGEQNDSLYIINRVPDPMNCRDWVGQGNPDTKVIAKVWQENEEANAAFIVHACNNIERLEKVNEALVKLLGEAAEALGYADEFYDEKSGGPVTPLNESPAQLADRLIASAAKLAKEPA